MHFAMSFMICLRRVVKEMHTMGYSYTVPGVPSSDPVYLVKQQQISRDEETTALNKPSGVGNRSTTLSPPPNRRASIGGGMMASPPRKRRGSFDSVGSTDFYFTISKNIY